MEWTILRMVVSGSMPAFSGQLAASAGVANHRSFATLAAAPPMPNGRVPAPDTQRVTASGSTGRGSRLDFSA